MVSSAGRAPPLQGGGHWFEPSTIHHFFYDTMRILLHQLWMVSSAGRAPPLQGGGHWFEPSTIHQIFDRRVSVGHTSFGWLAQLGEHRPYKAGVTGSNPVPSTSSNHSHS